MVELALLEAAANGNALDEGQAALVRAMCTSGARLQLAIAPAGAGKTTATRTLVQAWSDSGGQVVGLAPSAAAAAQLRDATGGPAETLGQAHLVHRPQQPSRLGATHRRDDVGDHRRSRDG
jgi:ATP-dependent exoDNAse (exonuclease V) alpha subunit